MEVSSKTVDLLKKYDVNFEESLFTEGNAYHETGIDDEGILLKATKLILNEQIDRIVNTTLSELYKPENSQHDHPKPCRNTVNSKTLEILGAVPPPKNSLCIVRTTLGRNVKREQQLATKSLLTKIEQIKQKHERITAEKRLLRKYFKRWKDKIQKNDKVERFLQKVEVKQKTNIEKTGKIIDKNTTKIIDKNITKTNDKNRKNSSKSNDNNSIEIPEKKCYENRYKAQQDIITMQKLKLLEQERVIEEMKHGKVCEELNISIKESRLELGEILRKCSVKTKIKIGAPTEPPEEERIQVKVNKAPKIVQRMEIRAQERAAKRLLIQERKRVIDEEKRRQAEEIVEGKRKQDEDERRKNLEAIRERRRRELEVEKVRRANKEKFFADCVKADGFYKKKLKRRGMRGFKEIRELGEENYFKGEIFHEVKLERKCFRLWSEFVRERNEEKLAKVRNWYRRLLLRRCFDVFIQNHNCTIRNYQVAMDYYDFRLQCRTFQWLFTYVCKERTRRYRLFIKADRHYNYRILVTYFYQWKSLKAVLVLEKAKEEKKKKWREKVLQILPDFRPPIYEF